MSGAELSLAEFLLARYAEEEVVACEARADRTRLKWAGGYVPEANDFKFQAQSDDTFPQVGVGIERVLAEVAAKRQVVQEHSRPVAVPTADGDEQNDYNYCGVCGAAEQEPEDAPCPTLRFLTLPYAGHPEFRAEWKP